MHQQWLIIRTPSPYSSQPSFYCAAKQLPKNIKQRDADIINDLRADPEERVAATGCCGGAPAARR